MKKYSFYSQPYFELSLFYILLLIQYISKEPLKVDGFLKEVAIREFKEEVRGIGSVFQCDVAVRRYDEKALTGTKVNPDINLGNIE